MILEEFKIKETANLVEAIDKIEKNHKGFVLLENSKEQIVGVLTDGDIRRKLISNIGVEKLVDSCANYEFIKAYSDTPRELLLKKLDDHIKFIPILNKKNRLVDIFFRDYIPLNKEDKVYARSKSPVRISFGGGGSDTYSYFKNANGAVINSTISLFSHALLKLRLDKKIHIHSADLNDSVHFKDIKELLNYDGNFNLIKSVIQTINPSFGFELYLDSDYPMSSGLGGSAVVLSAIIGCFNEFRNDKWDRYEIAEIAFQSERLLLNIDGGWQDQYATVFGGLNFMEFQSKKNIINPLRLEPKISSQLEECLILCYTRTTHDSGLIHSDQKQTSKAPDIKKRIKSNVDLTYEMKDYLLKGKLFKFGKCLDKAWKNKRSLSSHISNDYLDKIYKGAMDNGAIGGKLLGAGGGGYFLFYTPFKNRIKLKNWINQNNLDFVPFIFENKGLESWKTKEKLEK